MQEKTDRNKRLYQYHLKHPDMTLESLAGIFHLKSKQHVYQLLKNQAKKNGDIMSGAQI